MLRVLNKIKNKLLRIVLASLCIVLLFTIVLIAFISPIAKRMIERNSEKYIGRKVTMSWLYVNPFTGGVIAHNVIIFEPGSADTAIRAVNLYANITIAKLFSRTYELSSVTLDRAWVNVIQDTTKFNFEDWFQTDSTSSPLHINICNIRVNNSEIHYHELSIPVSY